MLILNKVATAGADLSNVDCFFGRLERNVMSG